MKPRLIKMCDEEVGLDTRYEPIKGSRLPDIDKVRLARTGSTATPDASLAINDNGTGAPLLEELSIVAKNCQCH